MVPMNSCAVECGAPRDRTAATQLQLQMIAEAIVAPLHVGRQQVSVPRETEKVAQHNIKNEDSAHTTYQWSQTSSKYKTKEPTTYLFIQVVPQKFAKFGLKCSRQFTRMIQCKSIFLQELPVHTDTTNATHE
jgi:hypothetical protein